jgi:hypothetical protein
VSCSGLGFISLLTGESRDGGLSKRQGNGTSEFLLSRLMVMLTSYSQHTHCLHWPFDQRLISSPRPEQSKKRKKNRPLLSVKAAASFGQANRRALDLLFT